MMMNDGLEQQMIISLELIQQKYQSLNELADQLLASDEPFSVMTEPMLEMKNQREEIERLTADNQPMYQRYRASRPHASAEVQQLTATTAGLMQSLLMKISKLERAAQSAQERLLPQIHQGVRAAQMKHAYGNVH